MTIALKPTTPTPPTSPLRPLINRTSLFLDNFKINSISPGRHAGRQMIIKKRSWLSRRIANLANFYFWLAHIPIRFCANPKTWQHRELTAFRALNPGFTAIPDGPTSLAAQKLPGQSLFSHLQQNTLRRHMLITAAKELHRIHHTPIPTLPTPFTHADATMSNILFDPLTRSVHFIDFEILHVPSLPLEARRADDLFVFLLDLVGYTPDRRWLPLALAFLEAYDDPAVLAELRNHLTPPRGLAKIWFAVRTNFIDPKKITRRLHALHQVLNQLPRFVALSLPS